MNEKLLKKHINSYKKWLKEHQEDYEERVERITYYQKWISKRLQSIDAEGLYEFMGRLWAMRIWGNKEYFINKVISDNTLPVLRQNLNDLLWGKSSLDKRWDHFRKNIKGIGPAMMSELLSHVHPNECSIWNRRVYVGLSYLEFSNIPRHSYQLTGKRYIELCKNAGVVAEAMNKAKIQDVNLLHVDYFIWQELQVEDNLSAIKKETFSKTKEKTLSSESQASAVFIHNEIRDKLENIGTWLGFIGKTEQLIASGAKVDTIWESSIGNMGRIIYVFEVQTKGSIDSLMINLLKATNNPAVQGIVAVSDKEQLKKIKEHANAVQGLRKKLKYWDYEEVLRVHDALELVNESINSLGLVPDSFFS
jgi:hypothetical protein